MIVVSTEDFRIYHEVVTELRERGADFTTVEPGGDLPDRTRLVLTGADEEPLADAEVDDEVAIVVAERDEPRRAVEEAFARLRGTGGRTVVGVDPGIRPGIAVLAGDVAVAAFQVPIEEAAAIVERELADAVDPVVRIGDGARLQGSRLFDDLACLDLRVELVDETGTTPSLGTGARGMGDVLAAVNIARREGRVVENRTVTPTPGELQIIKDRSRERDPENRAIGEELARKVAAGDLTIDEALAAHRNGG